MKKIKNENKYPYLNGLVALFIYIIFCNKITPPPTFRDLFPALINVSAIMIGFLSTSLSILYTQKESKRIKQFDEAGRLNSIVKKSLHAIFFYLLLGVICIICLTIEWKTFQLLQKILTGLLILVLIISISSSYRVIDLYYRLLIKPNIK